MKVPSLKVLNIITLLVIYSVLFPIILVANSDVTIGSIFRNALLFYVYYVMVIPFSVIPLGVFWLLRHIIGFLISKNTGGSFSLGETYQSAKKNKSFELFTYVIFLFVFNIMWGAAVGDEPNWR